MRILTALFLFLTTPLAAFASGDVTSFTLRNGLEVVVIEDNRAPVVTHMLWYRVGAADEEPGKSGIAHFLEHLLFKGTKSNPPGEFSKVVAANGGSENAFTSYDYTGYFQRVASDRLELMMSFEADRMRGLVLTEEDVITERNVVLEERNSRTENNPGALFSEQRLAALYMNHPYGIPIIGWKHEIEKLNREDAYEFYQKFYAPNNAILIVAGDVDPSEVLRLAKRHYGRLSPTKGLKKRERPTEPPQLAPRRLSFSDPRVSQPYVIRTYLAPERNPGDQKTAAALTMLAQVLGGAGLSSVFGQELELKQKIALHTSSFYDGLSLDKSGFGMVVVPVEGVSLQEAEQAIDAVLADFLETGPDPELLKRLKAQVRASEIYARDSARGMARRYGEALTSGLTIQDVEDWGDIVQSVTAEDIVAAANLVLNKNSSVTGWLMRSQEGEDN